jgi:glucokinase
MPYAIGIDLGGSSIKTVAVTPGGETLARANHDFDPNTTMDWAERIRQIAEHLQAQRDERASWLGLSAPGLAATDQRSIAFMPGRLHGLEGLDWTSYLRATQPVTVLNDAQAALLGEAWLGAAKGFTNVIMLTLGTGVGGAAIVDGHLLRGHIGRAGHLGHTSLDGNSPADVCGTPGSLEVAIGNCTIEERTGGRFKSTHDLVAAHLAADAEASSYWNRSVRALARAVVSFINLFDPEAVIIGGGIARSGAALFAPLERYVAEMEWRPGGHAARILPATLGELAGAYGAAKNVLATS